jgi:hypothetical protein
MLATVRLPLLEAQAKRAISKLLGGRAVTKGRRTNTCAKRPFKPLRLSLHPLLNTVLNAPSHRVDDGRRRSILPTSDMNQVLSEHRRGIDHGYRRQNANRNRRRTAYRFDSEPFGDGFCEFGRYVGADVGILNSNITVPAEPLERRIECEVEPGLHETPWSTICGVAFRLSHGNFKIGTVGPNGI